MIKNFNEVSAQLRELAEVINAFKSEAVQLRLVELIFDAVEESKKTELEGPEEKTKEVETAHPRSRRKPSGKKNAAESASAKGRAAGGRPGGMATLGRLLGEGFFKKPRTIKQLVEHCDHNLALKYQQSDFSGSLARFVRDEKLKRTKNSDKQYEYSQS